MTDSLDTSAPPPPEPRTFAQACRELLLLSWPFILSGSFTIVQVFIDRLFLARVGEDAMAAAMPTVGYFWVPMTLLQFCVMYVTVFVAQYIGAGRPGRVGPVVWQGLYFAAATGLAFPLLIPVVDLVIAGTEHAPAVKALEAEYFRGLSLAALPMLLVAGANAFFAGRQESRTVLLINAVGAAANALFAVPLIRWNAGDPAAAMFGAGLAAALGSWVAAVLGLCLLFRKRFRDEFATVSGRKFDPALFGRLMKYGLTNGLQFCIEAVAFTAFVLIIGNLGKAEGAATSLTFTLNLMTFLPVMGLGQGVEVLVGQRQGQERPDLSARTTHAGAALATAYMGLIALVYFLIPNVIAYPFSTQMPPDEWAKVAPIIPTLLLFVAAYSLSDGANIIYAYALRGAGDTRFVSLIAITTSWPLMVIPTWWLCWKLEWGLYWAWGFATLWVVVLAVAFGLRFLGGRWRTMKVIEHGPDEPSAARPGPPAEAADTNPATGTATGAAA